MPEVHFAGTLEAGRGGGAFVALPADALKVLGEGKRFRVRGRLNGVEFASSVAAMSGGALCLGVHKATRETASVSVGDTVQLDVERDNAPRGLVLPDELTSALADDAEARAAFEGLSFTRRREYVESIASAKRADTRARRLAHILNDLRSP